MNEEDNDSSDDDLDDSGSDLDDIKVGPALSTCQHNASYCSKCGSDQEFISGLKAKVQASLWDHYARTHLGAIDYNKALMPI